MSLKRNQETGKWDYQYRFTDWTGTRRKSTKRGFNTKREAEAWMRDFLLKQAADLSMTFENFVELYTKDKKPRIRENSWLKNEHIIQSKLIPYFGSLKMSEIEPRHVIDWQNEMIAYRDMNGKPYADTYLRLMHAQLSAILNHAVRFYKLSSNVAAKVGTIGRKESANEMLFWTKTEYLAFSDEMMDKPVSFYAFELLYWCGIRLGELLSLTPADFDFVKRTLSITKSYQRIKRQDIITEPKTPKSNRVVSMPNFICEEIQEYINMLYGVQPTDRIFTITKSYLHHELDRGSKQSGVKRIRVHDLRHSHVSLLIDMGFSALAIADRVGHESIDITYRYAHLFPTKQGEMADKLDMERGDL